MLPNFFHIKTHTENDKFVGNTRGRGQGYFRRSHQLQGSVAPDPMLTQLLLPPTGMRGSNSLSHPQCIYPSILAGKLRVFKNVNQHFMNFAIIQETKITLRQPKSALGIASQMDRTRCFSKAPHTIPCAITSHNQYLLILMICFKRQNYQCLHSSY